MTALIAEMFMDTFQKESRMRKLASIQRWIAKQSQSFVASVVGDSRPSKARASDIRAGTVLADKEGRKIVVVRNAPYRVLLLIDVKKSAVVCTYSYRSSIARDINAGHFTLVRK